MTFCIMKISIFDFVKYGLTAGLLVLLGAGCAKTASPVQDQGQPQSDTQTQDQPKTELDYDVRAWDTETKLLKASDYPSNGDCLNMHLVESLQYGKYGTKIDWTSSTFPEPTQELKDVLSGHRIWQLCYSSKESVIYFSMVSTSTKPVFELPSAGTKGHAHVFGFWKEKGFGNQNGKVVISPAFSAQGGGDESLIENLILTRTTSGYSITGETDGGDGPFWWDAELRYDVSSNRVKVVKQCENSGEYQDESGELIPPKQNCKTF